MSIQLGRRVVMALALAASMGAGAFMTTKASAAMPAKAPPAAPVIATVDLEEIIKGMKERTEKEKALDSMQKDLQAKIDGMVADAKNEKTKFDNEPEGPNKIALAKSLREKAYRAEFEKQYAEKLLGEMKAEMLRELYLKINAAVAALAKTNGYMLVMTSDEKIGVNAGDPDSVLRAIALKRMLYVDPAMDITGEVVTYLNNQFAAGGSAAPAPKKKP